MTSEVLIIILLLIVAFLYASVGHGGASGYIAVLTLFTIPLAVYKPAVLIMNIIIAGISFIQYYRAGYFKWGLAWPFLLTSIPCAFIGSLYTVETEVYKLILGLALIFPIIRLIGIGPKEKETIKPLSLPIALLVGAIIGLASGFLNIGGGIFLSPVIILLAWGNAKEAAGVSSLFIVLNSIAGLIAASRNGINFVPEAYMWLAAAIAGGSVGAYFGSHKFHQLTIRYLLSAVLTIAAVKLIFF